MEVLERGLVIVVARLSAAHLPAAGQERATTIVTDDGRE